MVIQFAPISLFAYRVLLHTIPKPTENPPKKPCLPETAQASRQRFRELRQCMQHDDDENPGGGNTLTPDSQVHWREAGSALPKTTFYA